MSDYLRDAVRDATAPEARDPDAGSAAIGKVMSNVEPTRVSWLWPGRIPLGRLTILDGDPGLGKSSATLDLAARVTTGATMPDGSRGLDGPRGVVLLGAEDGLADTVRPRLDAAGADVSRVYALTGARDFEGRARLPTVADVDAIQEARDTVDAALMVVDPLSAYMGAGVDGHRDTDVRAALAGLAQLAERVDMSVLCIRHLNKSGGGSPLYRGGGSIAIIAAARSGLLLARDPDDDDALVLATTKGNLAPPQPSLSLRLVTSSDAVRVEWGGKSERSASDLLARPDPEERSAREEAAHILRGELKAGPRPVSELRGVAGEVGVTWRTVQRAADTLAVERERVGFGPGGRWVWSLPGGTPPPNTGQPVPYGSETPGMPKRDAGSAIGDTPPVPYEGDHAAQADSGGSPPKGDTPSALHARERENPRTCACGQPIGPTVDQCPKCRYGAGPDELTEEDRRYIEDEQVALGKPPLDDRQGVSHG